MEKTNPARDEVVRVFERNNRKEHCRECGNMRPVNRYGQCRSCQGILTADRPVERETAAQYRGRALIVTLFPGYLTLKPKGTRQVFGIDYRAIYEAAMKLAARQALAERVASKKAAGKRRR